ncbi:MAG: hypothetical protein ACRDJW_07465 [Thermomicrobiales bacterium]
MPRPRFRGLCIWLAFVAALVVATPSALLAQEATPAATPEATAIQAFDLPAMILRPEDIGSGYGMLTGDARFSDLETMAGTFAAALGVGEGEARERLESAGLVTVYNATFALPAEPGEAGTARIVSTFLYLYGSNVGGQTGYDMLTEAWGKPGYEAVEGTKQWGNATQLARINQSDGADQRLLLSFRVHELVVGVVIQDGTGSAPTVEEIEALASALRRRMREVEAGGGPELPARSLHINPGGRFDLTLSESYDRLDGTTLRRYGEAAEMLAQREASYGVAPNVYHTVQVVQRRGVDENQPFTIVTAFILNFDDEDAAAEFVANGVAPYLQAAGVGRARVADDARSFGDASTAVIYDINYPQGIEATGYAYFLQVDNQVAVVQADAPGGVALDAVEKLVQRQVDCLNGGSCEAVGVPSGLVSI